MQKVILILSILLTTNLSARSFKSEKGRHLEILGVIDFSTVPIAQKIVDLANRSDKPISLLINSPGGYVFAGDIILNAMKQAKSKGVKFRCISGMWAASMAFTIFAECDERYAFPYTRLLFHPMSLSVKRARVGELSVSLPISAQREIDLQNHLLKALRMSPSKFYQHYYAETFWPAQQLKQASPRFLTIVESSDVKNLFTPERRRFFLFGKYKNLPSTVQRVLKRASEEFGE